jgi:hypothetical protein
MKKMRWAGHVARVGYRRGTYRILVGRPERKRPLRTYSCINIFSLSLSLSLALQPSADYGLLVLEIS